MKIARLWLIRDLKKKASRLVEKKGTELQVAKNSRKAQRYLNEVNILKGIHSDQVAKYALCGSYAHTDNEEVNKGLKKLAESKLVQKHMVEFEKSHHIPLDKRVVLMRALGAKYSKLKAKKRLALQEGKVSDEKQSQNSTEVEKLESPESPLPKVAKMTVTCSSNPTKSVEKVTTKKEVSKPKSSTESGENKPTSTKPKKAVNIEKQLSPWNVTKNIPKEMEIKQLDLENMSSDDDIITKSSEPPSPKENSVLDNSANSDAGSDDSCDPFFLRDDKPQGVPQEDNNIGNRLMSLSQTPQNPKPIAARKPSLPAKFSNPTKQQAKPRDKRPEIKKTEPPGKKIISVEHLKMVIFSVLLNF